MKKIISSLSGWLRKATLTVMAAALLPTALVAQTSYTAVVYPSQQATAGTARLSDNGTTYTLSNDLFSASFVHQDGRLTFGGCPEMNLKASETLFSVALGNGSKVVNSQDMTLESVSTERLTGSATAVKGSHHFDGQAVVAKYSYTYNGSNLSLTWRAELRDGSHYLKTDLTLTTDKDVQMYSVTPLLYTYDAAKAGSVPTKQGNTWGSVFMNDRVFFGLETPMGLNSVVDTNASADGETADFTYDKWTAADFKWEPATLPADLVALGYNPGEVIGKQGYVSFSEAGSQTATFQWSSGNLRLDVCGIDLVDLETGNVVAQDYHYAFTGGGRQQLPYTINVPEAGKTYKLRILIDKKTDGDVRRGTSTGTITWTTTLKHETVVNETELHDVLLQGLWSRNAILQAVEPWNVSAIVGVVDAKQKRRTILAYSERERAVPWRPFPHYNSWWELNIDRNNHSNPVDNLKESQVLDVVRQWKTNLFDKYGVGIQAFVIDDGWDEYGLWRPHGGFPNGFTEFNDLAAQMCTGIGAWLGPCGGYGESGNMRNKYWTSRGGQHRLSYAPFYDVFKGAINDLVQNYDTRYFKFDGISQQYPHPVGPDENTAGIENCEGIIRAERYVRENVKEDIFFNTTVGTWASPFWFHFTDAVWRGQDDWNKAGTNPNDREAWITYRDKLVYEWFVTESPMCPINSMMTHGVIISTHGGNRSSNRDYKNALNELRCAFACGSGMVELYCDYELLNSINNGALWKDMADCLKWQREQADVLPDAHWVGGNPWDGSQHNIYGWASWNGTKATLALRNGDTKQKTYTFTLRQALDIPEGVNTTITLSKAFDQADLKGLEMGVALDIDREYTVTLPASSVYVFNGGDNSSQPIKMQSLTFINEEVHVAAGNAVAPQYVIAPLNVSNRTLSWSSDNTDVATVKDGAITGVAVGTATITAKANDESGVSANIRVVVEKSFKNDLQKLIEEAQAAYDTNEGVVLGAELITRNNQFSSNATESAEGSLNNLLDKDGSTFWHSSWKGGNVDNHKHYLQVDLDEPISGRVVATVMRRLNKGILCADDNPVLMGVEACYDGSTYVDAGQMDLPYSSDKLVVEGIFTLEQPASSLRFFNDKSNNQQRGYWHCGDFQLNRVEKESANNAHPTEAAALAEALATARRLRDATQDDVDALRQAYENYLNAMNQETEGILPNSLHGLTPASATYDLQGRRVSTTTRGLYIREGRKVLK